MLNFKGIRNKVDLMHYIMLLENYLRTNNHDYKKNIEHAFVYLKHAGRNSDVFDTWIRAEIKAELGDEYISFHQKYLVENNFHPYKGRRKARLLKERVHGCEVRWLERLRFRINQTREGRW